MPLQSLCCATALAVASTALLPTPLCAAPDDTATATSFTYQGELVQAGVPLDGVVDITFTLWDQAVGGAQVSTASVCPNVQVSDGRFTASVDFGRAVSDPNARWVQIAINGETLSPRQRVTAAPYALGTPGLDVAPNGDVTLGGQVQIDTSAQFTGINRSNRISLNEFFGVHAPIDNTFGGMYVNVEGENGLPFYGYANAGGISAYHYFDPADETWKMNLEGLDVLSVHPSFVGVNRTTPITAVEFFGVEAPVEVGFGGMYVSTTGDTGLPFYGYSAGGTFASAYHYFNGVDEAWELNVGNLDRITVRADTGFVGFGTNPVFPLHMASGAACTAGGSWVNASSEALKENFEALDGEAILDRLDALPILEWNYRCEGDDVRHFGPTAEAFRAAFGLGNASDSIATVDADGVALAAIQGLSQRLATRAAEVERLDVENAALRDQVNALAERLERLERELN